MKKNKNEKIAVIVPTINEELNISILINKVMQELAGHDFIILVVDDNSSDNTAKIIKTLQKEYLNLYLLQRLGKSGIASAYIDGFKYCADLGCKVFIQMDADASHNPQYLPLMVEKLAFNDVVIASRKVKGSVAIGSNLYRRILSYIGSLYSRIVLNCPIKDLTSSYIGWKLSILNRIKLNEVVSKGFCFQIEIIYKAYKTGAQILEFPITYQERKLGKSKFNKKIITEAILNVLKIKFKA